MSNLPRPPDHVCCICNSAFQSQSDLTTHQAACLNKTPISVLVARLNKMPLPIPPTTPGAKTKAHATSRLKVSSVTQEQSKEQMRSAAPARRPSQSFAPVASVPPPRPLALARPSNPFPRPAVPIAAISEAAPSTPPASRNLPKVTDAQTSAQTPQEPNRSRSSGASPRIDSDEIERLGAFPICSSCRRAFLTTEALDHHLRESPKHKSRARAVPTEQIPIRCQRCDSRKVYMNEHSLEQHTREKHLHTFQPQKRVDAEPQTEAQAERTIDQYPITPLMMEPTAKAVRKNSTVAIYEGGHGVKATGGVDATVEAPHPKQAKAKILVDPVSGEAPRSKKQDEAKVLADTISGMNATGEAFHAKMQVEAKVFANPVAGVDATAKVQKQGKGNVIATLNPAASEFEPGKMIKAIGKVHSARAVADTPMVGTDNSDQLHQQILHSPPGQGNNLQPGVSAEDIMPSNLVGQLPQSLERKESPASKSVDSGVEFGDIQTIISVPEKEDRSNPAKRHNISPLPQSTRAERAASSVASATSRQGIMARIASFVAGSAVKVVEPGAEVESDGQSMELVPADISPQVDIFAELKAVSGTPWTSITYLGNKWSVIPVDHRQIHLKILRELCHSPGELLRCNFTLEPYKDEIIKFMQKCYTCRHNYLTTECTIHPGICKQEFNIETRKVERHYNCCKAVDLNKQKGRKPGCTVLKSHNFEDFEELANNYAFIAAPHPEAGQNKHKAVVLDCEMGGTHFNRSELILVTAVDFFTAEVLINNYVMPSVQILDWRTEYSGVTENHIREAIAEGECIDGWKEARSLLCTFIDTDTILLGHSLNNDLDQLRLIHFRVVDSSLTIPRLLNQKHSVKALCAELLGATVQRGGKHGHDCLEDTLAARELVVWCLRNPDAFIARQKQSNVEKAAFEEQILQRREQEKAAERQAEDKLAEEIVNRGKWDPEQRRLLKALLDTGITFEALSQEMQRVEQEREAETK